MSCELQFNFTKNIYLQSEKHLFIQEEPLIRQGIDYNYT